ncbi:MAG: DegT/DnrJ/EryC1/StrS family aminotransferase, partial [bacterium]
MNVPFIDLKRQYESIRHEIQPLVQGVIDSQQFVLGDGVYIFEKVVAEYLGVRYAIGVASGTEALTLSMKALRVQPGDEIITTPFTFAATANSMLWLGARPLFSDIDRVTYN